MKALIAFAIVLVLATQAVPAFADEKEAAFFTYVVPLAFSMEQANDDCFGVVLGEAPPEGNGTAILPDGNDAFRLAGSENIFFRVEDDVVTSVTAMVKHENKTGQRIFISKLSRDAMKLSQRNIRPDIPAGGHMLTMKTPKYEIFVIPQAIVINGKTTFHTWLSCLDR